MPLSLCLPVRPTLCRQMSTSMSFSLSDFLGAPTLITNTAFLMSIPRAIILVQSKTFVYEFLNFLMMSSLSACPKSVFLPSLQTLAAIDALVTFSRYQDYWVVKSPAKAWNFLSNQQISSTELKKTKTCGFLFTSFRPYNYLKMFFKIKSQISVLEFSAHSITCEQFFTPSRVILWPVYFSSSAIIFNLMQSGSISSQNFKKCFSIVAEQAITLGRSFFSIFNI